MVARKAGRLATALGRSAAPAASSASPQRAPAHTLVLYVFSGHDGEALNNLRFFVAEGIQEGDGCNYAIVLQLDPGQEPPDMPPLPTNAQYFTHPNQCYDWGTLGAVLRSKTFDLAKYKWLILLNSSVRGPFMPSYLRGTLHWSEALTARLTASTRVVGATINCGGIPGLTWPHVQSYLLATDRDMVAAVLDDPAGPFACRNDRSDTIAHSEMGFSKRALDAGAGLGSLMKRYEGVRFGTEERTVWGCNGMENPTTEDTLYDGLFASALEVMFVKVKTGFLAERKQFATSTVALQRWMGAAAAAAESGNTVAELQHVRANAHQHASANTALAMQEMQARGLACFDVAYYAAENALPPSTRSLDRQVLWNHFVHAGQFLDYAHRFTC